MRKPGTPAPESTSAIVSELFSKVVTLEGRKMSMREAMLRGLQNAALGGDMDAAIELQKLRDLNNVEDHRVVGCLVVPEIPADEWERLVYEQQAPFRDKNHGKDGF